MVTEDVKKSFKIDDRIKDALLNICVDFEEDNILKLAAVKALKSERTASITVRLIETYENAEVSFDDREDIAAYNALKLEIISLLEKVAGIQVIDWFFDLYEKEDAVYLKDKIMTVLSMTDDVRLTSIKVSEMKKRVEKDPSVMVRRLSIPARIMPEDIQNMEDILFNDPYNRIKGQVAKLLIQINELRPVKEFLRIEDKRKIRAILGEGDQGYLFNTIVKEFRQHNSPEAYGILKE